MIAFVDREWAGEIANRLRGVGRYHASRMLVLAYEPRRRSLDARVTISHDDSSSPGELSLLRETVVVELGDIHLDDLLTIADPLVVTDLPTLLWSPHGHHEVLSQLLALSQAVLLDSVEEPVPAEALQWARQLGEEAYVVDLAWLRSTPWRERVAASFDPPTRRRELLTITDLTVRHHPASTAAALLLTGWLASRLGLARSQPAGPRTGAAGPRPRQPPGRGPEPAGRTGADGARARERRDRDRRRSLAATVPRSRRAARPRPPGGRRRAATGRSPGPPAARAVCSARASARRCCATPPTSRPSTPPWRWRADGGDHEHDAPDELPRRRVRGRPRRRPRSRRRRAGPGRARRGPRGAQRRRHARTHLPPAGGGPAGDRRDGAVVRGRALRGAR